MDKPKSLTLSQIFLHLFTGLGSGLVGSIVLGILLLLSWGIIGSTIAPSTGVPEDLGLSTGAEPAHPLFLFFVMLGVFLSVLAASITHVLLMTVVDDHFQHRATILNHAFFGNLVLLLFFVPVYLAVAARWGSDSAGMAGLFHAVIAALFSFSILEILNNRKYLLVNLYGVILGLVLFSIAAILLSRNTALLAFLSLPLLIGLLSAGNAIVRSVYGWMYQTYGTDLLNSDARFGEDYGTSEASEE
ncbi:MAG: hypothetical protein K9M51_03235 [Candidatus Gracilibacteria bacterium]|nr:hypothetical protein [Candidatus Gracilibacteria bacterium]